LKQGPSLLGSLLEREDLFRRGTESSSACFSISSHGQLHRQLTGEIMAVASLSHYRLIHSALIAKEDQCVSVRIANAELPLSIRRIVNILDEFESVSLLPCESGMRDSQLARLEEPV